jgi:hypothetical protein
VNFPVSPVGKVLKRQWRGMIEARLTAGAWKKAFRVFPEWCNVRRRAHHRSVLRFSRINQQGDVK